MYSPKEFDRAFSMLDHLKRGKKPGFFTYPQYKSLYNHPNKIQIVSEYDKYFIDSPNLTETERDKRAVKLAKFVYQ